MNYFYIFPQSVEEDKDTQYIRISGQPTRSENLGIDLSYWPPDDILGTSIDLLCTERLKTLLKHNKLTGIKGYERVKRVVTNANWMDNYPESKPNSYWQIFVDGEPMKDDFAYYNDLIRYLICSEKAVRFLLNNHCTNILGMKIIGEISTFFTKYNAMQRESNYMYLPPKLLNIDEIQF